MRKILTTQVRNAVADMMMGKKTGDSFYFGVGKAYIPLNIYRGIVLWRHETPHGVLFILSRQNAYAPNGYDDVVLWVSECGMSGFISKYQYSGEYDADYLVAISAMNASRCRIEQAPVLKSVVVPCQVRDSLLGQGFRSISSVGLH